MSEELEGDEGSERKGFVDGARTISFGPDYTLYPERHCAQGR